MNFNEGLFLNFHAHQQLPAENEVVIQSKFLQEDFVAEPGDRIFYTSGLHPWHADLLSKEEIFNKIENLINKKLIIAIGETGLDKLKGADWDTQMNVFKTHIEIAEKYNLPLIVHSVRAHNDILKLKKESGSKVPWVMHYFNGSKEMALDLINHGFYLSVCHHINNDKSKLSEYFGQLAMNKIFLETDDFKIDIKELYSIASEKLGVSVVELKKQIMNNLKNLLNE